MKIGIIGAGAAGLMAAATIAELSDENTELFLIERNGELGKKVLISGGGRCNVTTGIRNMRELLTRYPRGSKFLQSALHNFPPESVYTWFEDRGVPLKTEEDLRVFPVSNDGHDIVAALAYVISKTDTHTLLNQSVTSINHHENGFTINFKNSEPIQVEKIIIATGGQTYRHTGSTGDGYAFAESCGHTTTSLAASLSSFISPDAWVRSLSGVSWAHARISLKNKKLPILPEGGFMFTHLGITGPAIFAFSALTAYEPVSQKTPVQISINLFPDESLENVSKKIELICKTSPKKSIENCIAMIVPKSLAEKICTLSEISSEKHAGEISKKEILNIANNLVGLTINAIGRGAGDEFVTAGGVNLSEVNPSTMESKLVRGLYFAGEVLDIDGFTGGFNLQASWATGRLAGQSAMFK